MIPATICIAIALLVGVYVWRRMASAAKVYAREEALFESLRPLHDRLAAGETVPASELEAAAQDPVRRLILFDVLEVVNRPELFPERFLSPQAQAEARLTNWLTQPNELETLPESLEYVETIRRHVFGYDGDFLVFRYRMPQGHWAGSEWILGLVGPYFEGAPPYRNIAGAFSRAGDLQSKISPSEVVEWYVSFLRARAGA